MVTEQVRRTIKRRLETEVGRLDGDAPFRVGLLYPSPYAVGMSSLGYQCIYRLLRELPGVTCERLFLPDDASPGRPFEAPVSYESGRPLGDHSLIAVSVAYEGELGGLAALLDTTGIGALRSERGPTQPLVLAGGPLTFSNPVPLGVMADAILMGEAEGLLERAIQVLQSNLDKESALRQLADLPSMYVPALHGAELPPIAACAFDRLPAISTIRSPDMELRNMFLLEAERGCSRGCQYCVMRRSTNGGMRIVPKDRILELIPTDARRIGLVGAAVSDHPDIVEIVTELGNRGCEVGLSSLRPDKLKEPFIAALKSVGYRTLTTALDGASERLRDLIERRGRDPHYRQAAALARQYGFERLKLYLMVGLPGETDEDIDECVAFVGELSRVLPVSLGIAPFCAKRNTPLDGMPFAGIGLVEARIERLRRGFRGRVDVRAISSKWAWVEHVLAQGGAPEGEAVVAAVRAGGRFKDYLRAFAALGHSTTGGDYLSRTMPLSPVKLRRSKADSGAGEPTQ